MAGGPLWATYSFTDFNASILGPGGQFLISGPDVAAAEEGATVTWGEENNTQNIGAAGDVMNSMHAAQAGTVTVRLQKTSPVNALLSAMWTFQRGSSLFWGRNLITLRDVIRGDLYSLTGCAFVRFPTNTYAKAGNMLDWEWHVAVIDPNLGPGYADGH